MVFKDHTSKHKTQWHNTMLRIKPETLWTPTAEQAWCLRICLKLLLLLLLLVLKIIKQKKSVISLTNHHLKLDAEQTPKMLCKQFLNHRYSNLTLATQYYDYYWMTHFSWCVDPTKMAEMWICRNTNNFSVNFFKVLNPVTKCYYFCWTHKCAEKKTTINKLNLHTAMLTTSLLSLQKQHLEEWLWPNNKTQKDHMAIWWWHFILVFGRNPIHILVGTSIILTHVSCRGNSIPPNAKPVPWSDYNHFLPKALKFIVQKSPYLWC